MRSTRTGWPVALLLRASGAWACHEPAARSSDVAAAAIGPLAGPEGRALSFRVLAEALARAGDPATAQELTDTLIEREDALDLGATLETLRCLVGVVCRKTGETPRSVLDAEFSTAPSDAFWRASLAREREWQPAAE